MKRSNGNTGEWKTSVKFLQHSEEAVHYTVEINFPWTPAAFGTEGEKGQA